MATIGVSEEARRLWDEVEVRSRFDGRWVSGFAIAARTHDGYLIRRRSDGAVLPMSFPRQDIRLRS